ncbi:MAG: flavin reductase [Rhizobiaceae bacterium]
MHFDLEKAETAIAYKLLAATVTPRPIAWVTTLDSEGHINAAPYSFFNAMGSNPPTIAIGLLHEPGRGFKDTARNIMENGQFVVNLVPASLGEAMNLTAVDAPAGMDELKLAGLETAASQKIAPPRIAASPVALECVNLSTVVTGPNQTIVIGRVVSVYVDDKHVINAERGHVDNRSLDLIGRSFGSEYVYTRDRFDMDRPNWANWIREKAPEIDRADGAKLISGRAIPRIAWRHLSRDELDLQHSPSRFSKDPWGVLARHEKDTAALDNSPNLVVRRDIRYGKRPRASLDLTSPKGAAKAPCLAFIHGGFWQEGSKAGSGFAAAGMTEMGWATASIGYTLTPQVGLDEILAEIAAAIRHLHANAANLGIDAGRIVLAGHSAGAHLAASILAGLAGGDVAGMIAGCLLISGVYDLEPVAASCVNDLAGIAPSQVKTLSPLLYEPRNDVPLLCLVGADEPSMFREQTQALEEAWKPDLSSIATSIEPARDHFDILDELINPESAARRFIASFSAR